MDFDDTDKGNEKRKGGVQGQAGKGVWMRVLPVWVLGSMVECVCASRWQCPGWDVMQEAALIAQYQ